MSKIRGPAPSPCSSCPYRRDVPSGLWGANEYAKLRDYDNPTWAQPPGIFQCHQTGADDDKARLCAPPTRRRASCERARPPCRGIRLGRNEAIAEANRGLTEILKSGKHFVVGPNLDVYVNASEVSDMLGRIR